jgi:glucokinase
MMNDTSRFVLAFDLGGTHLRAAMVDESGTIHSSVKHRTPVTTAAADVVNALVAAAREAESRLPPGQLIKAVSVAVPGSVNTASGVVVEAPNLSSLNGFQLAAALTSELGLAATVENDANAAAVGEMWRGAARGHRNIVCVTMGTGVGGGIILDGKLWRGINNSAGEIGHTCVDPFSDVSCTCGSRGCLERFASATAIVRMAREAQTRFPNSVLQPATQFTSADVYQAGVEGDALALEVMQRVGFYLGVALANLVCLLNPEMIVIGGGVANGWSLFAEEMRKQVTERAFPVAAAQVKIVRAEYGEDAGLLGAARLGFDSIAETDLESRRPSL